MTLTGILLTWPGDALPMLDVMVTSPGVIVEWTSVVVMLLVAVVTRPDVVLALSGIVMTWLGVVILASSGISVVVLVVGVDSDDKDLSIWPVKDEQITKWMKLFSYWCLMLNTTDTHIYIPVFVFATSSSSGSVDSSCDSETGLLIPSKSM